MTMDYQAALDYLHKSDLTMARYERDQWDRFVNKIHLAITFPFIHITGTNGKGSTAHYLVSIYAAAGYKVASFSSPYFYRINEMISFDGSEISDEDLARLFTLHQKEIEEAGLSAFEIETYIAFAYFAEKKPDIAIIEVGMGGALDATNLTSAAPLLSIVTSVSLEHTAFLGRTVSEIAVSKGGIIKNGAPVLVGKLPETAETTLQDIAKRKNSAFFIVDDFHADHYASPYFRFDYRPYKDLAIVTPASYQLRNASLALEAIKIVSAKLPVDELALRKGLLAPSLLCRLERHHNIILDGAHNPEAVEALMTSMESVAFGKKIHVLFASFRDKNIAVELPCIGRDAVDIILTTFPSPRARNEEDYFLYEADYPYNSDYKMALSDLVVKYPDDIILVTGSLAFAALAREYVIEELKL
jgi:dihydrofolate synthase / folylpolyglutamate synthase